MTLISYPIKTDEFKHSEFLKTMRNDAKVKDLGNDVRSTRRPRTGEMTLELKKDTTRKIHAYT